MDWKRSLALEALIQVLLGPARSRLALAVAGSLCATWLQYEFI